MYNNNRIFATTYKHIHFYYIIGIHNNFLSGCSWTVMLRMKTLGSLKGSGTSHFVNRVSQPGGPESSRTEK